MIRSIFELLQEKIGSNIVHAPFSIIKVGQEGNSLRPGGVSWAAKFPQMKNKVLFLYIFDEITYIVLLQVFIRKVKKYILEIVRGKNQMQPLEKSFSDLWQFSIDALWMPYWCSRQICLYFSPTQFNLQIHSGNRMEARYN